MKNFMILGSFADKFAKAFLEENRWLDYLKGMKDTVYMSLIAVLIGILIGLFIAVICNINKNTNKLPILTLICKTYVTIIRGVPMMLQLFIMYFVVLTFDIPILVAGIAFGINSGAYQSEIFRAGIDSIDKGQMEAGRSLGLSYRQTMSKIIIPQAIKNVIPPLGNEFIALIKETAIVGIIGIRDLTKVARNIGGHGDIFTPMLISAVFYLILVLTLTFLMKQLERRLRKSDNR